MTEAAPQYHPEESQNMPWPLRGRLWGTDRILGVVIKNKERKSEGGVIIPDLKLTQTVPHACRIVKVSRRVTEEWPELLEVQETHDPEKSGKAFENGPCVFFAPNAGDSWDFPEGANGYTWVILPARAVRFDYDPVKNAA